MVMQQHGKNFNKASPVDAQGDHGFARIEYDKISDVTLKKAYAVSLVHRLRYCVHGRWLLLTTMWLLANFGIGDPGKCVPVGWAFGHLSSFVWWWIGIVRGAHLGLCC